MNLSNLLLFKNIVFISTFKLKVKAKNQEN